MSSSVAIGPFPKAYFTKIGNNREIKNAHEILHSDLLRMQKLLKQSQALKDIIQGSGLHVASTKLENQISTYENAIHMMKYSVNLIDAYNCACSNSDSKSQSRGQTG